MRLPTRHRSQACRGTAFLPALSPHCESLSRAVMAVFFLFTVHLRRRHAPGTGADDLTRRDDRPAAAGGSVRWSFVPRVESPAWAVPLTLPVGGRQGNDQLRAESLGGAVMSWLIVVILFVLALLIIAGPVLEDLIDRVWPLGPNSAARQRKR